MSDLMDDASAFSEHHLQVSLANVASRAKETALRPVGACLNCREPFSDNSRLFCDIDCRDDFEKLNRR